MALICRGSANVCKLQEIIVKLHKQKMFLDDVIHTKSLVRYWIVFVAFRFWNSFASFFSHSDSFKVIWYLKLNPNFYIGLISVT